MKKKINFKYVMLVAESEYVKWLFHPKMILLAVIFLPMRDSVILPLLRASDRMGSPINLLEPCIATVNSELGLLLMAFVYMILMSSFPTTDGNMLFYIARMGRRNWILGEMLFQCMSVMTYSVVITIVTMLQVCDKAFLVNGWSLVVTDYDTVYGVEAGARIGQIVQPNLFFQMTPFRAYLVSFGLVSLFLMLCGMLFLVGCLYQKRLLFFFVQVLHISIGCGMMLVSSMGMWLFPVSHSFLACHYRKYFRKYVFSPELSLLLFLMVLLILGILAYRKARKASIDMIGGDVLP